MSIYNVYMYNYLNSTVNIMKMGSFPEKGFSLRNKIYRIQISSFKFEF